MIREYMSFTFGTSTEYLMFSKVSESGTNGSVTLIFLIEHEDASSVTILLWNLVGGVSFLNFSSFMSRAFLGTDEKVLASAAKCNYSPQIMLNYK
jgi:hypothetical protein